MPPGWFLLFPRDGGAVVGKPGALARLERSPSRPLTHVYCKHCGQLVAMTNCRRGDLYCACAKCGHTTEWTA